MAFYSWKVRNPFEEMMQMQSEMSRLMGRWSQAEPESNLPPVNVYDDGDAFHVRVELAGVDREKLDLQVAGDVLSIQATRPEIDVPGSYHRRERNWDSFSRSLTLPDTVDVEHVRADFNHGILEVTLPRSEEVRPRKIAIESR